MCLIGSSLEEGWGDYSKALELLETGDFYDAAEKA